MARALPSWAATDALVLGLAPDAGTLLKVPPMRRAVPGLKALVVECWGKLPRT
jgi:hypothetical protein